VPKCQVMPSLLSGKTFYRLALRPLMGPMHIPELTTRLQNPQVQYSPGSTSIVEPSSSSIKNTHLGSPTITHSQYMRENVTFKCTSTLVMMTCKSKTRRIQELQPGIKRKAIKSPSAIPIWVLSKAATTSSPSEGTHQLSC